MGYLEIVKRCRAEAGIGGAPATLAGEEGGAAKVGTEEGRSFEKAPCPAAHSPEHSRTAEPCVPDAVLTARHPLAALCRATLDANPAASKLSPDGRKWVAEHLEAAVLNWLSHVLKPEPAWDAECPQGHRITEAIFVRTLAGWCCAECEQVYPAGECRLSSLDVRISRS